MMNSVCLGKERVGEKLSGEEVVSGEANLTQSGKVPSTRDKAPNKPTLAIFSLKRLGFSIALGQVLGKSLL